jgi:hypothetical protein
MSSRWDWIVYYFIRIDFSNSFARITYRFYLPSLTKALNIKITANAIPVW